MKKADIILEDESIDENHILELGHSQRSHRYRLCFFCLADQLWFPFRLLALNPLRTSIVFLLSDSLFIGTWLLFNWLSSALTRPGLFIFLLFLLFLFLHFITQILTYPGQLRIVLHHTEKSFSCFFHKRFMNTLQTIENLVQLMDLTDEDDNINKSFNAPPYHIFLQSLQNVKYIVKEVFDPLLSSLTLLEEQDELSPPSQQLLTQLRDLFAHLTSLNKLCDEISALPSSNFSSTFALYFASLEESEEETKEKENDCDDIKQLNENIELIKNISLSLYRLRSFGSLLAPCLYSNLSSSNFREETASSSSNMLLRFEDMKFYMYSPPITNLALLRADVITRFNGEQLWIPRTHGKIDALFLPSSFSSSFVMVMCNPNGGLYEFSYLQSDWILFYRNVCGFNVLLFNYRGYGRNKGKPSPSNNNQDGESVIHYLKQFKNFKTNQIGVHGESIGGMVATHLAQQNLVHVMIADRTFADLPSVAHHLIAPWAGRILPWITRWNTNNVTKFLDETTECYKIICQDPFDEIIDDQCSLKAGVVLQLILKDEYRMKLDSFLINPPPASSWQNLDNFCFPINLKMIYKFYLTCHYLMQQTHNHPIDANNDSVDFKFQQNTNQNTISLYHQTWQLIQSSDGYGGLTLEHIFTEPKDKQFKIFCTWICNLLVYGKDIYALAKSSNFIPKDLPNQQKNCYFRACSIPDVLIQLQQMMKQNSILSQDIHLMFLISTFEFFSQILKQEIEVYSSTKNVQGYLVVLSCGHNHNTNTNEKQWLLYHLEKAFNTSFEESTTKNSQP